LVGFLLILNVCIINTYNYFVLFQIIYELSPTTLIEFALG